MVVLTSTFLSHVLSGTMAHFRARLKHQVQHDPPPQQLKVLPDPPQQEEEDDDTGTNVVLINPDGSINTSRRRRGRRRKSPDSLPPIHISGGSVASDGSNGTPSQFENQTGPRQLRHSVYGHGLHLNDPSGSMSSTVTGMTREERMNATYSENDDDLDLGCCCCWTRKRLRPRCERGSCQWPSGQRGVNPWSRSSHLTTLTDETRSLARA